jgi:hypothetical protein
MQVGRLQHDSRMPDRVRQRLKAAQDAGCSGVKQYSAGDDEKVRYARANCVKVT